LLDDPFFSPGRDWNWNACIGEQGDEEYYVNGYIEAAKELVDAIFDKKFYDKRDTLVLPILYNVRHAIELALKMAIRELNEMSIIDSAPPKNHNILAHWNHLDSSNLGDGWLKKIVADIKPFVFSLAQIDEDGQEFRYHETRSGKRSLKTHSVVNLEIIRESLNLLYENLKSLRWRIYCLRGERKGGFFTSDLSRNDLVQIAGLLPERTRWNGPEFLISKREIMDEFGISNRKFSEALKIIQMNRETKGLLGIETDICYLSDVKARLLANKHLVLVPLRRENWRSRIVYGSEINLESIMQEREKERKIFQELLPKFSAQEIADVSVVFYMGQLGEVPEFYENLIESKLQTMRNRTDAESAFVHVFLKANFRRDFVSGLDRLGRISLARELRNQTS
jgi:hypothetical protein